MTLPRCSRLRCKRIARIGALCVQCAEKLVDDNYRKLCREMDGRCMMAGKLGLECWGYLQGAHVYRVRHRAIRWSLMPRNCFALCQAHHRKVDNDEAAWLEYAKTVWTPEEFDQMQAQTNVEMDRVLSIEQALEALI